MANEVVYLVQEACRDVLDKTGSGSTRAGEEARKTCWTRNLAGDLRCHGWLAAISPRSTSLDASAERQSRHHASLYAGSDLIRKSLWARRISRD